MAGEISHHCASMRRRMSSGRWLFLMCSTSHCTAGFTPSPVRAVTACTLQARASGSLPTPNTSATSAGEAAPSQSCLLASTSKGAPYRSRSPAGAQAGGIKQEP